VVTLVTLHSRIGAAVDAGHDIPCRLDPELWFSASAVDEAAAVGYCRGCPARASCLAYIAGPGRREVFGVWGGVTPDDRGVRVRECRDGPRPHEKTRVVRDLLLATGLGAGELARITGLNPSTVRALLAGRAHFCHARTGQKVRVGLAKHAQISQPADAGSEQVA
jgi:WhiB family redox-sensing transcriptional regulator